MKMETSKIDFKNLFKIVKIDIDKVTFVKHSIERNSTLSDIQGYETVNLGGIEGEEIHVCKPEIIGEIAGQVGIVIKGFEVKVIGKKKKKVIVDKIIRLNQDYL